MSAEQTSSTTPLSLGQRLKSARESEGLSLETVSARLRVPVSIFEAIEADSFRGSELNVFIRGYIRSYAKLLRIPSSEIDSLLMALDWKPNHTTPVKPFEATKRHLPRLRLPKWPFLLGIATLLVIVLLIWQVTQYMTKTGVTEETLISEEPAITKTVSILEVSHPLTGKKADSIDNTRSNKVHTLSEEEA